MTTLDTKTSPSIPPQLKVGMLGCGNMGRAIAEGWLARGALSADQLLISARSTAADTAAALGARAMSPQRLLEEADLIILGFKPQQLTAIRESLSGLTLSDAARPRLFVSLLAGLELRAVEQGLALPKELEAEWVRLMPNLPARRSLGATLAFTESLSAEHRAALCPLLEAMGLCEWLGSEALFDVGTAISGCGPAYMFMMIEALADAGVSMGLPRVTAQRLAAQTMIGSGAMALDEHPGVLKDRVTSPGGVTIQGLRSLERSGLRSALIEAVVEAAERSQAMRDG